ncbi:MAG: hypothetical protein JNJ45_07455 [Chthonomonas sp.]|nr:hypothetical protein [Chthonomonas sp.]
MATRLWNSCLILLATSLASASYSRSEAASVQEYWRTQARYEVTNSPKAQRMGRWQVRLTPEGSQWLHKYAKIKGFSGKVSPTQDAGVKTPAQQTWEQWVKAKIDYDRYQAALVCREKNGKNLPAQIDNVPHPGDIPGDLLLQMESVPMFASAVEPKLHTITFDDKVNVAFEDNVSVRSTYSYYRFAGGVSSGGTSITEIPNEEVNRLYRQARLNMSVQRVMNAISPLEGGFDSINTYDTGYVSAGFIQFACLSEGAGSLGELLADCKGSDPFTFDRDFKSKGIDVSDTMLNAVNIKSGEIVNGSAAAMQIIDDKRLTAIFVRAGRVSDSYRVQQLRTAYQRFYPGDDRVKVTVKGRAETVRVSDIVRSEVGMATLMDRKVNTGNIRSLEGVLTDISEREALTDVMDLSEFESEIVRRMKWRKDFSTDATLTKPLK